MYTKNIFYRFKTEIKVFYLLPTPNPPNKKNHCYDALRFTIINLQTFDFLSLYFQLKGQFFKTFTVYVLTQF